MAVTIQVRRGLAVNLPLPLGSGEFGFTTDTHLLYIGDGASNHEVITINSTSLDSRYYTETEIGGSISNINSGAYRTGIFDEFTQSNATNIQAVIKDLDTAISGAMASGEVNTASNVGVGGVGVFHQKNLLDLEFKNINTTGNHISVNNNVANHEIELSVDATNSNTAGAMVARDGTGDFSANEITADLIGNADTASILHNSRLFSVSGDASTAAGVSFNGSGNVNLAITVDKVDSCDVNDAGASTADLWTASKIINTINAKVNGVSWQEPVLDKNLTAPPGGPATGDRYIVAVGGSGAWTGHDNDIAEWNGSSWDFVSDVEGFACYVSDEDKLYTNNGTSWVTFGSVTTHNNLSGLQGGVAGEYYHLTNSEHTDVISSISSKAANLFYASPNGSAGTPTFRSVVAADLPISTTAALGVASFAAANFTVTIGNVEISSVDGGVF